VEFTGRPHGDLAVGQPAATLRARRAAVPRVPGAEWTWLHQQHGAEVVVARAPGEHAGARADAVVTTTPGVVVAVHTADCAPVALVADRGVAVVHAGWRGLLAGVLARTVEVMADEGVPPHHAVLGPTIRPRCYEFGAEARAPLVERFGETVASTTAWGTPALDLPAGVAAALAEVDVTVTDHGVCTACSPVHWSHRARGDVARQALVAWIEP
jgi:YfiH family protein